MVVYFYVGIKNRTALMKKTLTAFLLISLIAISCKKTKTESESVDQLPPITQTGANTFGCLLNGNVWLPKGYDGRFVNSRITIDPTYADGDLTIRTYRIEGDFIYDISIGSDSIKSIGYYPIGKFERAKFVVQKSKKDLSVFYCLTNCETITLYK